MKYIKKSILLLCCCFYALAAGADANIIEFTCRMGNGLSGNCTPSFQSCLAGQSVSNVRHCNFINNEDHFMIGVCCSTSDEAGTPILHPLEPSTPRPSTTHRPITSFGSSVGTTSSTFRPVTEATIVEAGSPTDGHYCGVGPKDTLSSFEPSKIAGGKPAEPNSWPFMAALFERIGSKWKFFCGGSLLDSNHILTAAHCLRDMNIKDLLVVLGLHSFSSSDGRDVKFREFLWATPHEKYGSMPHTNDIAIMRMNESVTFNKTISPVCLPAAVDSGNDYVGNDSIVIGWGDTSQGGNYSDVLKQATLKVISNCECNTTVNVNHPYPTEIVDHMLCAISPGQDSCQSDSGGPLVIKSASGAWVQAGIVSWGPGCARPGVPGVYTRVVSFTDWISKNMHRL